jgi:hypothetical protein
VGDFIPGDSFNLLPNDPANNTGAEYLLWGGSGAIIPRVRIDQPAGSGSFNIGIIAFKSTSAGTAPSGPRFPCVSSTLLQAGANNWQQPCPVSGVNLAVVTNAYDLANGSMTVTSDSDTNTYCKIAASGSCIVSGYGSTYPQLVFAQNATFASGNAHYITLNQGTTAAPSVGYIGVGFDASAFDGGALNSGSSTGGGASCTYGAGIQSGATVTPTTNRAGVVVDVEYTGTGPECGLNGTNNVPDMWWYSGETDSDSYAYGASGYAHLPYTSNASQTFVFGWANGGTGSSYYDLAVAFKAPAAGGASPPGRAVIF